MIDIDFAVKRVIDSLIAISMENSWVEERGVWKENIEKMIIAETYHQELLSYLKELIYKNQNAVGVVLKMIGTTETEEDRSKLIEMIKECAIDIAVLGFFEAALGDENLTSRERLNIVKCCIERIQSTTYESGKLENRTEKDGVMPTLCVRDYKDTKLVLENQIVTEL